MYDLVKRVRNKKKVRRKGSSNKEMIQVIETSQRIKTRKFIQKSMKTGKFRSKDKFSKEKLEGEMNRMSKVEKNMKRNEREERKKYRKSLQSKQERMERGCRRNNRKGRS